MSFSSPTRGWAVGTEPCDGKRCLTLLATDRSGRVWRQASLPSSLVTDADRTVDGSPGASDLGVRFATADDGWLFGGVSVNEQQGSFSYAAYTPALWSTVDGGARWTFHALPATGKLGTVVDVEAADGRAYALVEKGSGRAVVEGSTVGRSNWHVASTVTLTPNAGGAQPTGAIVLKGSRGWLVYGNDRGTSSSLRLASNGTWVPWTSPCASVGNSFALPVASTSNDLAALCTMGGFAYGLSTSAPPGATLGSNWIYQSSNGGATFSAGPELRPVKDFLDVGSFSGLLASPQPHVYLVDRVVDQTAQLLASYDGGTRWHEVYEGQVTSLAFTSESEGEGFVLLNSDATAMIMTYDGGRTWKTVTF